MKIALFSKKGELFGYVSKLDNRPDIIYWQGRYFTPSGVDNDYDNGYKDQKQLYIESDMCGLLEKDCTK